MQPLVAMIIDDDADFRLSLEMLVQREGFETRAAGSIAEARESLETAGKPDIFLVDLTLPDGDGLAWLRGEPLAAGAEVLVITGSTSVENAVQALQGGALDYLTKPIDRARLRTTLLNVARTRALKDEVGTLRGELKELGRFGSLVGRSQRMLEVYDMVSRVAPLDATVFIVGESGTGKELVAETIHRLSSRKNATLLPVNCGAVSPTLIESELFGHERGSFTGADRQRKGYFERANGGTLFLDEVTEMPAEAQVKLLRVLETGTLVRVGGNEPIKVDVRVVAATNRNAEEAVKSTRLREDLYYRLNVFPITLPPLRDRGGDIDLLAEHFLQALNREGSTNKVWSRPALERLRRGAWPGNVRELWNVVQRAYILGKDEITPDVLPLPPDAPVERSGTPVLEMRVGCTIADAERRLILATLELMNGDKKKSAEALGISLKTLYNRLNVYDAERRAQSPPASSDVRVATN
jgi:two-component system, NtrC family, response regulator AtoC